MLAPEQIVDVVPLRVLQGEAERFQDLVHHVHVERIRAGDEPRENRLQVREIDPLEVRKELGVVVVPVVPG